MAKAKQLTREDLARKLREVAAQSTTAHGAAYRAIDKASTQHMGASAVIVHIVALGGRELVEPVAISDGLSADTIAAIKRDIARSYHLSLAYNKHIPAPEAK